MKKALSIALVTLMLVSAFAAFSLTSSAETTKLGGYLKAAGISFCYLEGKLCLGYDFDVAPVKSINFWNNKDNYTFTVTYYDAEGKVINSGVSAPVAYETWADTDTALYFPVTFTPEFGKGYGIKVEIVSKDGAEDYYVEELYTVDGDGKIASGAEMTFKPITEDLSGTIADTSITWKISKDDRILVIDGTGEMPDYATNSEVPWAEFAGAIAGLRVKGGVTKVGKNTASHTGVTEAIFEEGVQEIGMDVVAYCKALTTVYLPKSLTKLGQGTVYGSNGITAANYAGTADDWANVNTDAPYNDNIKDHLVYSVAVPADPNAPVDPPVVNPPVTGEATVALVIVAVVALFGTAVVASKKVFGK